MKTLIYAVDDEESIRELYSVALDNAGYDCLTFNCAAALYTALEKCRPSIILLDIMMEDEDGFAALENLKSGRFRDIPVIMVSAKGEEINKVKGLNMGADDYIAKPFGVLELIARINANLRKTAAYAPLKFESVSIDDGKHEVKVNGKTVPLTLKEYGLLKLLMQNAGAVVPREKILSAVWGEDYFGESRTLDIHIASLRKALQGSGVEIVTVRGVGYSIKRIAEI